METKTFWLAVLAATVAQIAAYLILRKYYGKLDF